jgi:hypothetical protein
VAKKPNPPVGLMASFPGQKGTGPPLPNQVGGVVATLQGSGGGGGTGPSSPTLLQSLLEAQTQQSQGVSQGLDFQPQNMNTRTLGWLAPVPSGTQAAIGSYRIYRSDNPTLIYAAVTEAVATSNYGTYVANSANTTPGSGSQPGPWPFQTLVNRAFTDGVCTTAVGYPQGPGPDFYQGNALQYQVTAVDVNGLESAKSATMVKWFMSNGALITCGGTFNGSMTPGATDGGTNPLTGNSKAVKWLTAAANDLINPFLDFGDTRWSGNLRPFTTLNLYIKASQSVGLQIHALRRIPTGTGDEDIFASAGNPLTVQVGTATTSWQLFPISLASIMTDYQFGQQTTGYKWDLQITTGGGGISLWLEWSFS